MLTDETSAAGPRLTRATVGLNSAQKRSTVFTLQTSQPISRQEAATLFHLIDYDFLIRGSNLMPANNNKQ